MSEIFFFPQTCQNDYKGIYDKGRQNARYFTGCPTITPGNNQIPFFSI
jgi:hypothetical protein